MVSDMATMFSCIFNFWDVCMRITINWIVPRGFLRGPPKKEVGFWGSFYQGEVGKGRVKNQQKYNETLK